MENSIENNLKMWNDKHQWTKAGDEWDGQAKCCRVPYDIWKRSLIETLILPNAIDKVVLEIGPGHGRWSEHIIEVAKRIVLVDISSNCIERCRGRFSGVNHVEYHINDGRSLPSHFGSEVDFVWSYDAFVHMDGSVVRSYFREFARVLTPGGVAIVHHSNRRFIWLAFLQNQGSIGRHLYRCLSEGWSFDTDGWRSNVSGSMIAAFAQETGLHVEDQIQYWGDGSCGVPRFNDRITILRKPKGSQAASAGDHPEPVRRSVLSSSGAPDGSTLSPSC